MQTSIKKIITILFLIVLLPLIIYTIYELTTLSENEQVIQEIYSEQLNTIIFSVNQYTDDAVQVWTRKIGMIYSNKGHDKIKENLNKFCDSNSVISLIVIADTSISDDINFYPNRWNAHSEKAISRMQNILKENNSEIYDLIKFKNLGYNKILPLKNEIDETPLLSFLVIDSNWELKIVTLVINIDVFINDVIFKKISSISDDELVISIFNDDGMVTSTGDTQIEFNDLLEHTELWNLNDYYLGISTTGKTIKEISRERTITNLIVLLFLNLIIILGVWFLFKNFSKEIKLSQMKSDFVSNVSHEIRTPLSLIGMFAETLELNRVNSEEEKFEYYKIIRRETERLTRIVNSILNFSKMESDKEKYNFEKSNLNDLLDEVLETYQHEFNNNKNQCIVIKSENLADLKLDRESIIETIMNLIDNALKYCEKKCIVEISTSIKDNFVILEIADNGIGISKEDQKKIFDKFYRVSSGNVHNTKGSGLGLSLVKNIMRAHNGSVTVESKLSKGSKFILQFPIS